MWIRRSKFVCVQRSLFVYRNTLHMYAFITIMILLGEQPTNQMLAFFFLLFFYLFCCFFFVRSNVVDNNKFVMRQFAIRKKVDSTIFCKELKYIYLIYLFETANPKCKPIGWEENHNFLLCYFHSKCIRTYKRTLCKWQRKSNFQLESTNWMNCFRWANEVENRFCEIKKII